MATASKKPAAKKATSEDETRLVKDLANILDKAGLAELEYKTETLAIRLSRLNGGAPVPAVQPVAVAAAASVPIKAGEPATDAPGNQADHPGTVKSPMVGVAYLSADPESPAYVKVGQHVKAGDTLLLIEAMKTFNEIKAPKSGVIKNIIALNSQPVEFGDHLLIFE